MTLLVTGATGHVGYALVREAARRGEKVLAQGRRAPGPELEAGAPGDVRWIALDLGDRAAVAAAIEREGVDRCIHCAAVATEFEARKAPGAAFDANVATAVNLLEAMRQGGKAKRFVLVSTGSVFQRMENLTVELSEETPTSVVGLYSTTKHCAELMTECYRSQLGMPATTVRIPMVYGPPIRVAPGEILRGPIPAMIAGALAGRPVRFGRQFEASYTYIDDVVSGLLAVAGGDAPASGLYHIVPGRNFTCDEVADIVRRLVPGSDIVLDDSMEPWTRYARMRGPMVDTRLARERGFTLGHSLEAGIAKYIEWWRRA
jgi:nucleoside-diphosphate-sugar epimerase